MTLSEKQEQMCSESKWDFSDLSTLFLNCTLKKSPEMSHTQGLLDISMEIMGKNGVSVECLRPVDHDIATAFDQSNQSANSYVFAGCRVTISPTL